MIRDIKIDETTHLLSNKDRAERLQKAIQNVRNDTNVKFLTFDELYEFEKRVIV